MIVGVDASVLVGPRSGAGQTAASVVDALVQVDEGVEVVLLPVGWRSRGAVRRSLDPHPRVRVAGAIPAKIMGAVWSRTEWPPAELFCGRLDVFWGPNVALPPLVKAAGVATINDLAFQHVPDTPADEARRLTEQIPKMAARANRIAVPSQLIADEVASWLPDEAPRIRIVKPGVRRVFRERGSVLTAPRREKLGIEDPYAVFLGNLETRKNVEVLLRSFDLARAVHPRAQLVLIGAPGPGWDGISARCATILDSGSVRVVGYLPDEEVAAIVRGAKVFVYPSRYEGFGIAPLEAMVAGTSVIAAKTSALPETLGDHARWVHPDDVEGLAAALADHFEGDADPAALEAARSWAAGFTWADAALSMLEVFDEAMEETA
jgi:glycosyltransferase involved in cell wall biosynthesis